MKTTLGSGHDVTLSFVGHNFMYRGGEGDIRVVLMENNSTVIHDSVLRVGQDLVGSPVRFEKVKIVNLHDGEQQIEFDTGSMQLVDTNDGSIVSIASARDVEITSLPSVVVSESPMNPQKYFGSTSQVVGFDVEQGVHTYVTPEQNVSGLIVYHACSAVAVGGARYASLLFGEQVPLSYLDGYLLSFAGASGSSASSSVISSPIYVSRGFGLYSYLSSSSCNVSVVYEVLGGDL